MSPLKIRCPSLPVTVYWRLKQRSLRVLPWESFVDDCVQPGMSVAIVGNAGYLNDLAQAERIDRHDLVIRMNNFRLEGFERSVGRRLDVFLTNFYHDIDFANPVIARARFVVSSVPNNFRKYRTRRIRNRHGEHITAGLCKLCRPLAYAPDLAYFEAQVRRFGGYPTTGASSILLALDFLAERCGDIFITGFSCFAGASHYFSGAVVDPSTNHNMTTEKAILADLLRPMIARGKVQIDPVMAQHLGLAAEAA